MTTPVWLRQSAAPLKTRIKKHLEISANIVQPSTALSLEERITDYKRQRFEFENSLASLQACVDELDAIFTHWSALVSKISDPSERTKEEKLFAKWAEDEESPLGYLHTAKERCLRLTSLIKNIDANIQTLQPPVSQPSRSSSTSPTPAALARPVFAPPLPPSLPQLGWIEFSGEPERWAQFISFFDAAIASYPNLSNVQKFMYLLRCLKGEALALVSAYAVSDANYSLVMDLLKREYGDETYLTQSLYRELRNLHIDPEDSLQGIRDILRLLSQLKELHASVDTDSVLFMIHEKLPRQVYEKLHPKIYEARRNKQNWTVKDTMQYLSDYVREQQDLARIYGTSQSSRSPQLESPERLTSRHVELHNFASNIFDYRTKNSAPQEGSQVGWPPQPRTPCTFCGGLHWNSECTTFASEEARLACIREKRLCFHCLKEGHSSSRCTLSVSCSYCKGRHNRALCRKLLEGTSKPQQFTLPSQDHATQLSIQKAPIEESETSVLNLAITSVSPLESSQKATESIISPPGAEKIASLRNQPDLLQQQQGEFLNENVQPQMQADLYAPRRKVDSSGPSSELVGLKRQITAIETKVNSFGEQVAAIKQVVDHLSTEQIQLSNRIMKISLVENEQVDKRFRDFHDQLAEIRKSFDAEIFERTSAWKIQEQHIVQLQDRITKQEDSKTDVLQEMGEEAKRLNDKVQVIMEEVARSQNKREASEASLKKDIFQQYVSLEKAIKEHADSAYNVQKEIRLTLKGNAKAIEELKEQQLSDMTFNKRQFDEINEALAVFKRYPEVSNERTRKKVLLRSSKLRKFRKKNPYQQAKTKETVELKESLGGFMPGGSQEEVFNSPSLAGINEEGVQWVPQRIEDQQINYDEDVEDKKSEEKDAIEQARKENGEVKATTSAADATVNGIQKDLASTSSHLVLISSTTIAKIVTVAFLIICWKCSLEQNIWRNCMRRRRMKKKRRIKDVRRSSIISSRIEEARESRRKPTKIQVATEIERNDWTSKEEVYQAVAERSPVKAKKKETAF